MRPPVKYRDDAIAQTLVARIRGTATRHWTIMEVCGERTRAIVKQGLHELLRPTIEMIHGPGCPVCMTPLEQLEKGARLAAMPNVVLTGWSDMFRAPGNACHVHSTGALGDRIHGVHSPLDALELAVKAPHRETVFFAIGFETAAPAVAMAVLRAQQLGVSNFSVLVSQITLLPAMTAVLEHATNRVQAFLTTGHVCSVMGWMEYEPIAVKYRVPIVVTGFEPIDLLESTYLAVRQLEEGRYEVENQSIQSARPERAPPGRELTAKVFQVVDRQWGEAEHIPASGLALRATFSDYDAEQRFGLAT